MASLSAARGRELIENHYHYLLPRERLLHCFWVGQFAVVASQWQQVIMWSFLTLLQLILRESPSQRFLQVAGSVVSSLSMVAANGSRVNRDLCHLPLPLQKSLLPGYLCTWLHTVPGVECQDGWKWLFLERVILVHSRMATSAI